MSDFTFDPQLAGEYASAEFIENLQLLEHALCVVKTLSAGSFCLSRGKDFFADRAVILRRKAGPVKFAEDLFSRGLRRESAERKIGRQIGREVFKEVRARLMQVAVTALDSLDSPVADAHIHNVYVGSGTKAKLTLSTLCDTRMKLGDAYNRLTTVVCHSEAFSDLLTDTIGQYKVENVGGQMVVTGLPQAFGMRLVVVDDENLKKSPGSGTGTFAKYRTLLFGPDALGLIYHQRLALSAERRLDWEAPYWRVLANFEFAPHLFGMKWAGADANPDNTALGAAANWIGDYDDHREVLCAELVHNATVA